MADDAKPAKPAVRQDFIKGGGTPTIANEQMKAREAAETARRQAHHDRIVQTTARGKTEVKRDETGARIVKASTDADTEHYSALYSRNIGALSDHATIVLRAENRDKTVLDYIICNLVVEDAQLGRFVLVMVCPSCLHKHGKTLKESHITLRSYHRAFSLHERHRGELWVNPRVKIDPNADPKVVTLAGSVDTHEVQTCPLCAFRFEIGQAKIEPGDPIVSGAVRPV